MAKRVTLDAMIPREDFGYSNDDTFDIDLFRDFPISYLQDNSPQLKLLRKPDFQRETNQWTPEQVATFVASFLDNEVIPSLILWKSQNYIFVLDGGHRLSALRAWIANDYGDGPISNHFYKGEIPEEQKRIAKRTRTLVEQRVGRFSEMNSYVDNKAALDRTTQRAKRLFTRALNLQWVQGDAAVAETSFFKINSQGTPLDETETLLIRNRRKPIAIGARAILRAGTGHKYWSGFSSETQSQIEKNSEIFFNLLFKPDHETPLKTLDVPLGGTVSPVDALSLLIEFLTIAGNREHVIKSIEKYDDDEDGKLTLNNLSNALEVLKRITGNNPASLGLHTGVYFYNERGKYSRFLFLGMISLISEKLKNNDSLFFKNFTNARTTIESFLIDNKSLIGIILQNLGKTQRVSKMRDMFDILVKLGVSGEKPTPEHIISQLGLRGRFFDINSVHESTKFSDDTKSTLFINSALKTALKCPICNGFLEPKKSVSYDHIIPVREGGTGTEDNGHLVHPYCNTGVKC